MRYFKNLISFTIILYILATFILFKNSYAATNSDPKCYAHPAMSEVTQTVNEILADLEKNKQEIKANPKSVYKIINKTLVPKADFEVMSQLVLTRNWKKMNDQQRKDFTKEFSRLMIRTYGVAFESYDGETVSYECPVRNLPSTGGHQRVEIATTIHSMNRPDNVVKFRILKAERSCNNWQENLAKCGELVSGNTSECKDKTKSCITNCQECEVCGKTSGVKNKIDTCKDIASECKSIQNEYKNLKSRQSDTAKIAQADSDYSSCKSKYESCKNQVSACKDNCGSCDACLQDNYVSCSTKSGNWLVYDLIIDNVSIINSYRQIFTDKFKKQKDPNKVIAEMHEKNCKDKMFCV